jgi:hypothetical protein
MFCAINAAQSDANLNAALLAGLNPAALAGQAGFPQMFNAQALQQAGIPAAAMQQLLRRQQIQQAVAAQQRAAAQQQQAFPTGQAPQQPMSAPNFAEILQQAQQAQQARQQQATAAAAMGVNPPNVNLSGMNLPLGMSREMFMSLQARQAQAQAQAQVHGLQPGGQPPRM